MEVVNSHHENAHLAEITFFSPQTLFSEMHTTLRELKHSNVQVYIILEVAELLKCKEQSVNQHL